MEHKNNNIANNDQFFRVSKAIADYHKQEPTMLTEDIFEEWISGLEEPMKGDFTEKGFEQSKTALPFRRYALERNNQGMRDYMRSNLSAADFEYYKIVFEEI